MPMKQNFFFDIILKHTVQNAQFQNLRLVYDKNCWFYKYAKFSYFTVKNGIRITWPKCHMTSTCDVSLCDSWDQANMARMKKAAEWKGGQYCVADAPNKQSCTNNSYTLGIRMHQWSVRFWEENRFNLFKDIKSISILLPHIRHYALLISLIPFSHQTHSW